MCGSESTESFPIIERFSVFETLANLFYFFFFSLLLWSWQQKNTLGRIRELSNWRDFGELFKFLRDTKLLWTLQRHSRNDCEIRYKRDIQSGAYEEANYL